MATAAQFTVEIDVYYFDYDDPGKKIPSPCVEEYKALADLPFETDVTAFLRNDSLFDEGCSSYFRLDETKVTKVEGANGLKEVW